MDHRSRSNSVDGGKKEKSDAKNDDADGDDKEDEDNLDTR